LKRITHPGATISLGKWNGHCCQFVMRLCARAFHRDFNLDKARADLRYDAWLRQLCEKDAVYGLLWHDKLAGFVAHVDNNLVLHAVVEQQRGKGLAGNTGGAR
jgi:hypothetical protein